MSDGNRVFYNADDPCPKCGHDDIVDTYLAEGEMTKRGEATENIIDRQCENCYYNWATLPKDHIDYE